MSAAQIIVTLAGAISIAVLACFFFRSRTATEAVEQGGVQEVRVVVPGGYSPDEIRARTGLPLRIVFDRQEDGDCSSRVVSTGRTTPSLTIDGRTWWFCSTGCRDSFAAIPTAFGATSPEPAPTVNTKEG